MGAAVGTAEVVVVVVTDGWAESEREGEGLVVEWCG